MLNNIININNLHVQFKTPKGLMRAVNGLSFSVEKNITLGIVGESGCGKTVLALSILGLLPKRKNIIVHGEINFNGHNLLKLSENQMQNIRGNYISMIFQDPSSSLNPSMTIGKQISEVIQLHKNIKKNKIKDEVIRILSKVKIIEPDRTYYEFPHQLSGGMRQRIMIGIALACKPKLLIADEPTTALDVTIQAQILELMKELQKDTNTAIILISHDLSVIAEVADKVIIMYAGNVVEEGDVFDIFDKPLHPYTKGLLSTIPRIDLKIDKIRNRLQEIPGSVPQLSVDSNGCPFAPRCSLVTNKCELETPPKYFNKEDHFATCWNI